MHEMVGQEDLAAVVVVLVVQRLELVEVQLKDQVVARLFMEVMVDQEVVQLLVVEVVRVLLVEMQLHHQELLEMVAWV